ncbi:MAG: DUF971 domain-containing protein [Hyphomicrobiales bacterium]|uniref:gamma-butyrobetaine hydroxylase-like domain-containing protein n=1 Tax=Rhabdaerophilum calidifontis TaxID=2604328 RepID=UPI00123C0F7B|nr:DUF971 domain-containing protein [Rhabdaerophilum calidifontis]MCA1952000.1 DUF971 domain-containing protein [Hyphomicrobiales bacterium]MCA1999569.1 DUF971 domain-containing protein [Hyphomicrobiales bacterium]
MSGSEPWPTEIRLAKDRRSLALTFSDGLSAALSAEMLRVMSPSAEVQGHSPAERKTVPGKREVMILAVEPVGNYAIRLRFDDMHDTGLYGWPLLYRFARERDALFDAYLAELEAKGLSRDRIRRG